MKPILLSILLCASALCVQAQQEQGLNQYEWFIGSELLNDPAQRQTLLEKYPEGLSEERFEEKEKGLNVSRWVYHNTDELIIMEKKEWDWEGVFVSRNGVNYPFVEGLELPIHRWQNELEELKTRVAP